MVFLERIRWFGRSGIYSLVWVYLGCVFFFNKCYIIINNKENMIVLVCCFFWKKMIFGVFLVDVEVEWLYYYDRE